MFRFTDAEMSAFAENRPTKLIGAISLSRTAEI
jgi:hypothetical protein